MNSFAALGLSPGASVEDVRRAYRKRAQRLHPDHRPGDQRAAAEFRALHEAYLRALAWAERRDEAGWPGPVPQHLNIAGRSYVRQAGGGVAWWNEATGEWTPVTPGAIPFAGHLAGRGAGRIARWWRS